MCSGNETVSRANHETYLTNHGEDFFSANHVREETKRDSDHVSFPAFALSCDSFVFLFTAEVRASVINLLSLLFARSTR